MRIAETLRELQRFFLPAACLGCDAWIPSGLREERVCGPCRARLHPLPSPRCDRCDVPLGTGRSRAASCEECRPWPDALTLARSAVVLAPPADRLVHALKYEGWRNVASLMAERMARVRLPRRFSPGLAAVVPVPTTGARRRRRGYNQARVLAEALPGRRGDVVPRVLLRVSGGGSQVSLHPSQRRANVRRAFVTGEDAGALVRGRPVLLVDDVLTTGATAGAAARTLEAAGASGVAALTFARALPYRMRPRRAP